MNKRESFEAWFIGIYTPDNMNRDGQGNYISTTARLIWQAWQAALASQAQQPSEDQRAKLVANMLKYLGATKTQAKAIVDGVFDGEHTINESDLQSQAQQSQWISVEERLPELSNRELIVRLKPKRKNTKIVEYRIAVYNKPCEWEEPVFWCVASEEDVEVESWSVIPPAPEGE